MSEEAKAEAKFIMERCQHIANAAHTIAIYMGAAKEIYDDEDVAKMKGVEGGLMIAADIARDQST